VVDGTLPEMPPRERWKEVWLSLTDQSDGDGPLNAEYHDPDEVPE
jgi:hypothetical protein